MTSAATPEGGHQPDTKVRRLAEKAVDDPAVLADVVRAARLAHVGVVIDGLPYVLPVACAPWDAAPGNRLADGGDGIAGVLLHGSTGSRLFRALASGAPTCLTITHLDGLVLARSAYNSSMTYRSAMLMGTCEVLTGEEKELALEALTDHLLPGRRKDLRGTTSKEDAATMVLGLTARTWSVKVATGGPDDPPEDVAGAAGLWAGVVPLITSYGEPQPDEASAGLAAPGYIATWPAPGTPVQ